MLLQETRLTKTFVIILADVTVAGASKILRTICKTFFKIAPRYLRQITKFKVGSEQFDQLLF